VHEQQGLPPTRPVPWLVFDGDCAFCTTSATWVAARLHRRSGPDALLVPWQLTDLQALATTEERARNEVLWVEPDGRIEGGAAAFAAWLRFRGGPYALLGRTMATPGVQSAAALVYRFVARHRDRMPGGTPACALPPAGSPPATTQPGS
jgi:predicted DCC family thiol-disulfide oxidoreductase YuxK